jgi:hypothetical protein
VRDTPLAGAKAQAFFSPFTARLKSCPDTKHHSRDYRSSRLVPQPGFAMQVPALACAIKINATKPTVPLIWTALRWSSLTVKRNGAITLVGPSKFLDAIRHASSGGVDYYVLTFPRFVFTRDNLFPGW